MILYPWGYTSTLAPDHDALHAWATSMEEAIFAVHGHRYVSMPASDLYPCAGTAVDYGYLEANSPFEVFYSTTFEGRGPGFDPAPSNIRLAGEEQLPAVIVTCQMFV